MSFFRRTSKEPSQHARGRSSSMGPSLASQQAPAPNLMAQRATRRQTFCIDTCVDIYTPLHCTLSAVSDFRIGSWKERFLRVSDGGFLHPQTTAATRWWTAAASSGCTPSSPCWRTRASVSLGGDAERCRARRQSIRCRGTANAATRRSAQRTQQSLSLSTLGSPDATRDSSATPRGRFLCARRIITNRQSPTPNAAHSAKAHPLRPVTLPRSPAYGLLPCPAALSLSAATQLGAPCGFTSKLPLWRIAEFFSSGYHARAHSITSIAACTQA